MLPVLLAFFCVDWVTLDIVVYFTPFKRQMLSQARPQLLHNKTNQTLRLRVFSEAAAPQTKTPLLPLPKIEVDNEVNSHKSNPKVQF